MEHSQAIRYWQEVAKDSPTQKTAKVNPRNDFTAADAEFILSHTDLDSEVLDLACGTGLTINKYYREVGHIDAVEIFPEFTKFIAKSTNISIYNEDITTFKPTKKYDCVLMFGIVQYFNESEIEKLYTKYKDALKKGGKLIIKNQFGVNEDVFVSGHSKEIGRTYYSEYRHLEKEIRILKSVGFRALELIDIYPPEANRWKNTHFYAVVAQST